MSTKRTPTPKRTGIPFVNAHDALLAACKAAVNDAEKAVRPESRLINYHDMKAAIALAEKGQP